MYIVRMTGATMQWETVVYQTCQPAERKGRRGWEKGPGCRFNAPDCRNPKLFSCGQVAFSYSGFFQGASVVHVWWEIVSRHGHSREPIDVSETKFDLTLKSFSFSKFAYFDLEDFKKNICILWEEIKCLKWVSWIKYTNKLWEFNHWKSCWIYFICIDFITYDSISESFEFKNWDTVSLISQMLCIY